MGVLYCIKKSLFTESLKCTSVHCKSVTRIRPPPVWILILSIGICNPCRESTVGLISCLHSQDVGVWRIPSRLVIRVNILLVQKCNRQQQVTTQTSHGCIVFYKKKIKSIHRIIKYIRVHCKSVTHTRPPAKIIILSIGIRNYSSESTVGLISCLHSQHVGIWRIPSRLVIRVNILLVQECNLQQVTTQATHGRIVYHLLWDTHDLGLLWTFALSAVTFILLRDERYSVHARWSCIAFNKKAPPFNEQSKLTRVALDQCYRCKGFLQCRIWKYYRKPNSALKQGHSCSSSLVISYHRIRTE